MIGELVRVETLFVAKVSGVVSDSYRGNAQFGEKYCGVRTNVTKALDDRGLAFELDPVVFGPFQNAVNDALACGLFSSK